MMVDLVTQRWSQGRGVLVLGEGPNLRFEGHPNTLLSTLHFINLAQIIIIIYDNRLFQLARDSGKNSDRLLGTTPQHLIWNEGQTWHRGRPNADEEGLRQRIGTVYILHIFVYREDYCMYPPCADNDQNTLMTATDPSASAKKTMLSTASIVKTESMNLRLQSSFLETNSDTDMMLI